MAIQTLLEKLAGSSDSMQQPVFVYDDGDPPAAFSEEAAKAAAESAAATSIFDVGQDGSPGVMQLSQSAWRITINYRTRSVKQLLGEVRYNVNLVAEPLYGVRFAPELARFPSSAPSLGGLVTYSRSGNSLQAEGVTIQPPKPNAQASITIARSLYDENYAGSLISIIGKYNAAPIAGYAVGEVFMSQINVQLANNSTVLISGGWSIKPNVSNETRGAVTGISYRGHDYVWEDTQPFIDRDSNTLAIVAKAVYINDVWGGADISQLGLDPPASPSV